MSAGWTAVIVGDGERFDVSLIRSDGTLGDWRVYRDLWTAFRSAYLSGQPVTWSGMVAP